MNREELESQQNQLLSADGLIFTPQFEKAPLSCQLSVKEFLKDLVICEDDVIKSVLGDFGLRARDFANVIDIEHPDLQLVFGMSDQSSSWPVLLSQYLKIGKYAKEQGLWYVLQDQDRCIRRVATKRLPRALKYLDSPYRNQQFIRLLPKQEDRDKVRQTKSIKSIDLRNFYKKGQSGWDGQPQNFHMYLRFSKAYKEEIEKAKKRAMRYFSMGCREMAQYIEEDIEQYEELFQESYLGFHRITMTNAAVILAKMHGFSTIVNNDDFTIAAPDSAFDGYFGSLNYGSPFYYQPRAYPLNKLGELPARVSKLITRLEHLPEMDGKSAFDHYIAVVPSVSYPENLDEELIRNQVLIPIVLGEKDGDCYFLSYYI